VITGSFYGVPFDKIMSDLSFVETKEPSYRFKPIKWPCGLSVGHDDKTQALAKDPNTGIFVAQQNKEAL
jgi:hypothetical protein